MADNSEKYIVQNEIDKKETRGKEELKMNIKNNFFVNNKSVENLKTGGK